MLRGVSVYMNKLELKDGYDSNHCSAVSLMPMTCSKGCSKILSANKIDLDRSTNTHCNSYYCCCCKTVYCHMVAPLVL